MHRALIAMLRAMRRHRFVVHLDVKAFFPSVDLDIMRSLLAARIDDPALMEALGQVFEIGARVYSAPEVRRFARLTDEWPPPGRGLPIGASTSQFLATHVYLMALDHFVKRQLKVPAYARYGDDLCCFGDRRADLRRWRSAIGAWLGDERGLRLKHPQARILSCAGHLDALGYRITRARVAALNRPLRRVTRRVADALDGRPGADVDRSMASTAGVLFF